MALSKIDVANMLTGVTPVANGGTARTVMTGTPIQVVNSAAVGGNTASSSTSFAASGYSLAITPAQASSKIFISFNGNGGTATGAPATQALAEFDLNSGGEALTLDGVSYTFPLGGATAFVGDNTDGSMLFTTACVYGGPSNTLDDCANVNAGITGGGVSVGGAYDFW